MWPYSLRIKLNPGFSLMQVRQQHWWFFAVCATKSESGWQSCSTAPERATDRIHARPHSFCRLNRSSVSTSAISRSRPAAFLFFSRSPSEMSDISNNHNEHAVPKPNVGNPPGAPILSSPKILGSGSVPRSPTSPKSVLDLPTVVKLVNVAPFLSYLYP